MPVTPQRNFRPIPGVPSHISAKASTHGKFSIVTYNVLADLYANSIEIHGHCPLFARSWPYRRQNLLHELLKYEADILCLQVGSIATRRVDTNLGVNIFLSLEMLSLRTDLYSHKWNFKDSSFILFQYK